MTVGAQRPIDDAAISADLSSVVVSAGDREMHRRIVRALAEQDIEVSARAELSAATETDADAATIIVLVCNVDAPREMASLRRLRREMRLPAIVAISPPATGTGVRRALDAGADALVFEPELERTLATTVRAVAIGQSVVPRKVRASVERPVLSHREQQVLTLVRNGLTNAEIAKRLFLAESTIKSHLSSIFTKFGVRSRKEVAAISSEDITERATA